MKTLNQLLDTPGVRGVITIRMKPRDRGVSAPKFEILADNWPEWAMPHWREAPQGRSVILLDPN